MVLVAPVLLPAHAAVHRTSTSFRLPHPDPTDTFRETLPRNYEDETVRRRSQQRDALEETTRLRTHKKPARRNAKRKRSNELTAAVHGDTRVIDCTTKKFQ